jgi:undecaprenyl-diphosphatase
VEDIVITFFASFAIWLMFLGLGVLWVIDGKIKKEQVIHAIFSCLFAFLIASIIKHFFPIPRPFVVNGGETDVLIRPHDSTFPSEHTVIAFALAVQVFLHDRKVGWFFLGLALIIGMARVAANVHYPLDILGGAFLGTITAVVTDNPHFLRIMDLFSKWFNPKKPKTSPKKR